MHACCYCLTVSSRRKTIDIISGTMGFNGMYRYNLLMESSILVNTCVSPGSHITLYASTYITNPNAAFYEYYLDVDNEYYDAENMTEVCSNIVIDLKHLLSGDGGIQKRSTSDTQTVYFSVVGKATANTFRVTMNDTFIEHEGNKINSDYNSV